MPRKDPDEKPLSGCSFSPPACQTCVVFTDSGSSCDKQPPEVRPKQMGRLILRRNKQYCSFTKTQLSQAHSGPEDDEWKFLIASVTWKQRFLERSQHSTHMCRECRPAEVSQWLISLPPQLPTIPPHEETPLTLPVSWTPKADSPARLSSLHPVQTAWLQC